MLPVILQSYRPKADGSWSLTLATNILRKEEKDIIDALHQKICVALIKDGEDDITEMESEAVESVRLDDIDKKATQSQRLRAVFYRIWEQDGSKGEFKDHYKVNMEKIIEHFKNKLD